MIISQVKGYISFRMGTVKRISWFLVAVAACMAFIPLCRASAQEARFELVLNVLPGYYYREIIPGEESTLYLEIRNNGNQAVTDISLISDAPRGWDVSLGPESIDHLSSGSSRTVKVRVTAPAGTGRGEYTLTLIAEASQASTATSLVLCVESAFSLWLWIAAGLAALVIATFVIVFLRLRRD